MTPVEWLLSGDTGISSKTICAVMTGSSVGGPFGADVPHDPADFGRCYRLLKHFPEWRPRLIEVGLRYPAWRPMVEAWDELTALYEEEMNNKDGKAPKLFNRMCDLVDAGRLADGWKKTGPHSWRGPKSAVVGLGNGLSIGFEC